MEESELLITAEQLNSQRDAPVPLPWQNSDVPSVDRRIKDVLLVDVVVTVSKENLTREESNHYQIGIFTGFYFVF